LILGEEESKIKIKAYRINFEFIYGMAKWVFQQLDSTMKKRPDIVRRKLMVC